MTKVMIHTFRDWDGGKADGYYEPASDTIHILRGEDLELRARIHEGVHASRCGKLSFRLARLVANPLVNCFMWALFVASALTALLLQFTLLFFFMGMWYMLMLGCWAYEEAVADQKTMQTIKAICGGDEL